MATKQSKTKLKVKAEEPTPKMEVSSNGNTGALALDDAGLDPQEEKVLDWILKGVVAFILGWLGLSILMVAGGFFGIWK